MGTALCFGFVCIWHGASSAVVRTTFEVIARLSNNSYLLMGLGDLVRVELHWHLSGNNGQIFLYISAYCRLESANLADVLARK